jgi:hypothetical protein
LIGDLAEKLFGGEATQSMGAVEAAVEGFKAGMQGYMEGVKQGVDAAYSDGMKHFAAHGAHELAAALFGNGQASGFVMYQRSGLKEDFPQMQPEHGLNGQAMEPPKQERGGMSM